MSAARKACVVGLTPDRTHPDHLAFARDGVLADCSRLVHRRPLLVTFAAYGGGMREAFHEQLDSIFSDLAEICQEVETSVRHATQALLNGDAEMAERVIARGRQDRHCPRAGRGHGVLPALAPAAGGRRPPGRRVRAADGQRARADGRPLGARRQDRPPAGARHRGARGGTSDGRADGRGRRGHGAPRRGGDHRRATSRPRSSSAATTRRWTSSAARQLHPAALRRLAARRGVGRRHRPARPLLRADRRPRRLGRQPRRLRGHRPVPGRTDA